MKDLSILKSYEDHQRFVSFRLAYIGDATVVPVGRNFAKQKFAISTFLQAVLTGFMYL
jgi:hypothetical protein